MEQNTREGGGNFTSHSQGVLAPALRILCLHDAGSNAAELSDQLEVLGERLYEKHMIDLVYVNSPLLMAEPKEDENDAQKAREASHNSSASSPSPRRVWWEEKVDPETEQKQFVGLDASLLLLRQVWNSMPFWGILAVGQGAAAAAFLPLLPVSPPPSCMVFLQGESLLEEAEPLLVDNRLACLHLMAKEPSEASERLLQQFGGQVFTGASRKWTQKSLNIVGKFLVTQKKTLRTSNAEAGNILVLQNHLFLAEQEAANAVAQRIALDPPKALMAVISPQNVGGWSGGKRRGPDEEGGGAPCPSEFLLNREKRNKDPHGPSREHPSQLKTKSQTNDDNEEKAD